MAVELAIRQAVLFAWAGKCFYCGRPATCVDHAVAIKKGGTDDPRNLVASCTECNRIKGDLWLPLPVLKEALAAAKKLAPNIIAMASLYRLSAQNSVDRLNYGSLPLREGTPGLALTSRAIRRLKAARDLAVEAAEIASWYGVIKTEIGDGESR